MTLQEWVNKGNPMLSNFTTAWACQIKKIREKDLQAMELEEIYQIPQAGEVAKREILRWKQIKIIHESIQSNL